LAKLADGAGLLLTDGAGPLADGVGSLVGGTGPQAESSMVTRIIIEKNLKLFGIGNSFQYLKDEPTDDFVPENTFLQKCLMVYKVR
jgi:hypothetical protein